MTAAGTAGNLDWDDFDHKKMWLGQFENSRVIMNVFFFRWRTGGFHFFELLNAVCLRNPLYYLLSD